MIDYHAKIAQLTRLNDNQAETLKKLQGELAYTQAWLKEVQHRAEIIEDAWEHQKRLTHDAMVRGRETFDEYWDLKGRVATAESDALDWKRMYYSAIAKPPAVL